MATRNTVSPSDFSRVMKTHWTTTLGNTSSPELEQLWAVMAETFNEAILIQDRKWRVLEPPTGTGKTQGLIVYCSMIALTNDLAPLHLPTGILVVVRRIEEAEAIVSEINRFCGRKAAIARHHQAGVEASDCHDRDVLVITHSAYQKATEAIYRGIDGKGAEFTEWCAGGRSLTVIDEALANIVEQYQVTAHSLRLTLGYLDKAARERHAESVVALQAVLARIEDIERFPMGKSERVLWEGPSTSGITSPGRTHMTGLLREIRSLPLDQMVLRRDSPSSKARLVHDAEQTLLSCEALLSKWAYLYPSGDWKTLNSSELVVPFEIPGPVVLDATASQNMLWELLGSQAVRPAIPRNTRNYRNVRLRVAHATGLGKTKMTERGHTRVERVIHDLERTHQHRSVLLCVHQNLEARAQTLSPNFGRYEVAHWGAIDGRNDWRDFDTVVILGLPFRGTLWATNTFFALEGVKTDEWLDSPTWRNHKDIRSVMDIKQVTVSVLQAINRIRCRKSINAEGDCPEADVFVVLPEDHRGASILENIRTEMPGIQVRSWDFKLDGEKVNVGKAEGFAPIISYMASRLPGETSMNKVRTELGWHAAKMKELGRVLRNPEHFITKTLKGLGVTFHCNGKMGRGSTSWLAKESEELRRVA